MKSDFDIAASLTTWRQYFLLRKSTAELILSAFEVRAEKKFVCSFSFVEESALQQSLTARIGSPNSQNSCIILIASFVIAISSFVGIDIVFSWCRV